MDKSCIELLESYGIKPTANRILVLDAMLRAGCSLSLSDLEAGLETVDKSSIFRTLNLFRQQQLVHSFEDGSGSMKYEICRSHSETCAIGERHIHFFCEVCHQTTCLTDIKIPVASLPEGYTVDSINYTVKGVCPACNQKRI